MSGETISFFNNIEAGTFLAVLVFVVGLSISLTTFTLKVFSEHRKKVKAETMDDVNFKSLTETVSKLVTTVDRLEERVTEMSDQSKSEDKNINEKIGKIAAELKTTNDKIDEKIINRIDDLEKSVIKLTDSSQASTRSFIVSEYHKWMECKYIDIYSLSVVEDQYNMYRAFDGNTFVQDLMQQIRSLPTKSMIVNSKGVDPVNYFELHPDHHPKYVQENRDKESK